MAWKIENVDGEIHVYDDADGYDHVMDRWCECKPYVDRTPGGARRVNHSTETPEERRRHMIHGQRGSR